MKNKSKILAGIILTILVSANGLTLVLPQTDNDNLNSPPAQTTSSSESEDTVVWGT